MNVPSFEHGSYRSSHLVLIVVVVKGNLQDFESHVNSARNPVSELSSDIKQTCTDSTDVAWKLQIVRDCTAGQDYWWCCLHQLSVHSVLCEMLEWASLTFWWIKWAWFRPLLTAIQHCSIDLGMRMHIVCCISVINLGRALTSLTWASSCWWHPWWES